MAKLLLVEDDPNTARTCSDWLRLEDKHTVDVAVNGENSKGNEQLIPRDNNNHVEHKAVKADRDRLQQSKDPASMPKGLPAEQALERPKANLKPKNQRFDDSSRFDHHWVGVVVFD